MGVQLEDIQVEQGIMMKAIVIFAKRGITALVVKVT